MDVKPGMYFSSEKWGAGRRALVLKKSAEKITMLMLSKDSAEVWVSSNEWRSSEWKETWMGLEKPALLSFSQRRNIFREIFKKELRYA
jgi:hypothetical protein